MIWRILFALLFASLTALTAVRAFFPERLDVAPAALTPARQQVIQLIDDAATAQAEGTRDAVTAIRVERLARSHPLDPTPYSLELIADDREGDRTGANQAALMALTMQPRNRSARMHVINELVRTEQYAAAIDQITLLSKIDRSGRVTYENAIVRLAANPATWPALEAAVHEDPPWKEQVVLKLVQANGNVDLLRRLFSAWPERLNLLLDRLVSEGDYDAAYLIFVNALPDTASLEAPFDPGFTRQDGVTPFTWELNKRYAERRADTPGISLVYFGRGRARLLRQIFPVVPGTYEFDYELSGEFPEDAARFTWRVTCLPDQSEIAGREIAAITVDEDVSFPVEVPAAGCAYLDVSLNALPGRFPQTSRLLLEGVSFARSSEQG